MVMSLNDEKVMMMIFAMINTKRKMMKREKEREIKRERERKKDKKDKSM